MSRISSTAKRYAGSSYSSHYTSYGSSLTPGISSYGDRERLSSYKSPTSSLTSSGYSSSNYLSSSTSHSRNYSTSSDPDRDRGRTIPCTDILGSSGSRRSESLSRTSVKSYGGSGLSGGSAYTGYSSFSACRTQPSYLSTSPASSISLSQRKSVSQSDLSRDLASLGLTHSSSSSFSSTPSSSSSALNNYRSRTSDVAESYLTNSRLDYAGLSRSSTKEAFSRSPSQRAISSSRRTFSSSSWEQSSNGLSDSPTRDSMVRKVSTTVAFTGLNLGALIYTVLLRRRGLTREAMLLHLFGFCL